MKTAAIMLVLYILFFLAYIGTGEQDTLLNLSNTPYERCISNFEGTARVSECKPLSHQ